MSKVYLETWQLAEAAGGFFIQFDKETQTFMGRGGLARSDVLDRAEALLPERARFAMAAPQLVRALLPREWVRERDMGASYEACPSCGGIRRTAEKHRPGCTLDAALSAAGLVTQEQRDEARKEIAK